MSTLKLIKQANSKGDLIRAIKLYQQALAWYADEANWATKEDDIVWLGDDDPTYAAAVTLGQRKSDPNYKKAGQR